MGLFNKKVENKTEHIVVFLLRQKDACAWVCAVDHTTKQLELIDERKFSTSHTWDSLEYDIDEVLFNFEKELDVKIQKATFFVYSHLIDPQTGELQDQYMEKLKSVLVANSLESLGYIEIEESLSQTYAQNEHMPLNAMLLEVDVSSVFICVYKGGKKLFHEACAKSGNVIIDIENILAKMPTSLLLPARILMYDSPAVEHESHDILMHAWNDKRFIQLPQVGIVKESDLKGAIIHGVSQELFGQGSSRTVSNQASMVSSTGESGMQEMSSEELSQQPIPSVPLEQNVMGFVIGADVRTDAPHIQQSEQKLEQSFPTHEAYDYTSQSNSQMEGELSDSEGDVQTSLWDKLTGTLSRMKGLRLLPNINSGGKIPMKKIGIGLICVLVLIGGVGSVLYFAHSARVTVLYATEPIIESYKLTDEVKLTENKEVFSASAKVSTTGTDDVGEKAKGTLTLYNADDKSKTFDKGTKIKTSDGNLFIIDKAVTVDGAKKTITDEENILTSTSKASVTAVAEDIGTKYNIKKDVKLIIEGFSDTTYFAKSESAFTGGSSKQIQTVDKADYAALDKKIKAEIDAKSAETLKKISGGGGIVKALTVIDTSNQTYSKEIAEEADEVASQVKAQVMFYSLVDGEVKNILLDKIGSEIPDGYSLSPSQITFRITQASRDKKSKKVTLGIESKAFPQLKLDSQAVVMALRGKSLEDAEKSIRTEFKAEGIDANVTSPLPFLESRIPFFAKNISINLAPLK